MWLCGFLWLTTVVIWSPFSISLSAIIIAIATCTVTWSTTSLILSDSAISCLPCYMYFLSILSDSVCLNETLLLTPCNVIGHECSKTDVADLLLFIIFICSHVYQAWITGGSRGCTRCMPPFGVHHKNPLTNVGKPDENCSSWNSRERFWLLKRWKMSLNLNISICSKVYRGGYLEGRLACAYKASE